MKGLKIKRLAALLAAGMMTFSMAACDDVLGGLFGGAGTSEETPQEQPIILTEVTKAKNVILMIGDGMGPEHIKVGAIYNEKPLTMEGFPYMTKVNTSSASSEVTDSAAAATAYATGVRVSNGVIGRRMIGDEDMETIVDIAHSLGKRTGIIATEEIYGATPMGFMGHADSRSDSVGLVQSAAESSNVNFFASTKIKGLYADIFETAGYERISVVDEISESTSDKIYGYYGIIAQADSMSGEGAISFDRVVYEALEYLSKDEDGFFLMAEGSHIDHGGHNNDMEYMLRELLAFDLGVKAVLEWAKDRDDTVVIVTADHETGGLELSENLTAENLFELDSTDYYGYTNFTWTSTGHTSTEVNCYINGANIDFSKYTYGTNERICNTDVFEIMKALMVD